MNGHNVGKLTLSRGLGESIIIGDDVVVTVLAIRPNDVRLAIKAPRSTSVDREEIYLAKHAGTEAADAKSVA
jgi:carbon storage regulator